MFPPAWLRPLAALVVTAAALAPAHAAPVPGPTKEQIARWITELGDGDFATREKAQERLWQAGRAAEHAVKLATQSGDAEVRRRAGEIHDKFRWGIFPDTPKPVVTLIREYQGGDRQAKLAVVRNFLDQSAAGCVALFKIAEAEEDELIRRDLRQLLAREAGRALPVLIAEQNFATLDALMDLTLQSDRETAVPGYVAYALLRGQLDDRIKHFLAQTERRAGATLEAEVLVFLLRARGDSDAALALARKIERKDIVEALLIERGDWKELTTSYEGLLQPEAERLGFRLAFHRLAGDAKGADAAADELHKLVARQPVEADDRRYAAKALLLNRRPDEALTLLDAGPYRLTRAELLVARAQYAEALACLDKMRDAAGQDTPLVDLLKARILHITGRRKEARELLVALGTQIKPRTSLSWFEALVQWEHRLGYRDLAFDHCARAVAAAEHPHEQERLLRHLFPGHEATAWVAWTALRRKADGEEPSVSMARLRELMAGRVKGAPLRALLDEASPHAQHLKAEDAGKWLMGLAELAQLGGDDERAETLFRKAGTAGAVGHP